MSKISPARPANGALYVPASGGTVKWLVGDEYTIKVSAAETNGSLGFVVGLVPPGSGPMAHVHNENDEAFYLLDGELEFLGGDEKFVASAGDFVYVPRGIRHRFLNKSSQDAKMPFLFTPGGQEEFFLKHGRNPVPGKRPERWTVEDITPEMVEMIEKSGTVVIPE